MNAGSIIAWVIVAATLVGTAADGRPRQGHRSALRGKISGPTDINNVVATDNHRGFATASGVICVRLFETKAATFHGWRGHSGAVTSLAFSSDLTVLASSSADASVKLWDVASATDYEIKYDKFDTDGKGAAPSPPAGLYADRAFRGRQPGGLRPRRQDRHLGGH